MKVAKVVGRLSLVKAHPSLVSRKWVLAMPLSLKALTGGDVGREEEIIAADDLGATNDTLVAITDGREAAAPYEPEKKPVDAYVACILDEINVDKREANKLLRGHS